MISIVKPDNTQYEIDQQKVELVFFEVGPMDSHTIGPFPDVERSILAVGTDKTIYYCGVDTYQESYEEGGRTIPYIFMYNEDGDILELENILKWAYIDPILEGIKE